MRVWLSKGFSESDWITIHVSKPDWNEEYDYWNSEDGTSECFKHLRRLCRGTGVKLPKTNTDLVEADIQIFPANGKK